MIGAEVLTLVGAGIVSTLLHAGPRSSGGPVPLDPRYAVAMFTQRGPRLANLGYFGHMWELYALWSWLPTFLLARQTAAEGPTGVAVSLTAFAVIGVAGAVGCLLGGLAADWLAWVVVCRRWYVLPGSSFFGGLFVFVVPLLLVCSRLSSTSAPAESEIPPVI